MKGEDWRKTRLFCGVGEKNCVCIKFEVPFRYLRKFWKVKLDLIIRFSLEY